MVPNRNDDASAIRLWHRTARPVDWCRFARRQATISVVVPRCVVACGTNHRLGLHAAFLRRYCGAGGERRSCQSLARRLQPPSCEPCDRRRRLSQREHGHSAVGVQSEFARDSRLARESRCRVDPDRAVRGHALVSLPRADAPEVQARWIEALVLWAARPPDKASLATEAAPIRSPISRETEGNRNLLDGSPRRSL